MRLFERCGGRRSGRRIGALVGAAGLVWSLAGTAAADPSQQTVSYHGVRLSVPASWPVVDLATRPSACVRLDRHAVYEGRPGANPDCPARVLGVTEAVQIAPLSGTTLPASLSAARLDGRAALVNTDQAVSDRLVAVLPGAGVVVTVSYRTDRALAEHIVDSLTVTSTSTAGPAGSTLAAGSAGPGSSGGPSGSSGGTGAGTAGSGTDGSAAQSAAVPADSGAVSVGPVDYTGPGFDHCGAPSGSAMAAWKANSAYRVIGVYIGGANAGCAGGNLSASWVNGEVAAGWHLIPIYVGLQAPCVYQGGLAVMSGNPTTAADQGAAAAEDAASEAQSLGLGAGSPITFDMEGWNTDDGACNQAVASFVTAWSRQLGADGYQASIYGSADAGIAQVVAPLYGHGGPGYLYFADWDGDPDTSSPYIPSTDWPGLRRVKQYNGNLTQTYGGVTMNIDQDYAGGLVVGNQRPAVSGLAPASATVGATVTVQGSAFVPGRTSVSFGGVSVTGEVSSPDALTVRVPARAMGTVPVTVTTPGGTSGATRADAFGYVPFVSTAPAPGAGGYWMASSAGNVYGFGASWQGSMAGRSMPAPVVGIVASGSGYLLVTSRGNVYGFDAPWHGSTATWSLPAPVVGAAVDAATGGYWLVTSKGDVYGFDAPVYGSMAGRSMPAPVVGIVASGSGYLLVTSRGNVYGFDAPWHGSTATWSLPAPVVGAAVDPATGGYWIATAAGNVYGFDAPWYGSPAYGGVVAPVTGIEASGSGYLVTTEAGNVYAYNAAYDGSPAA